MQSVLLQSGLGRPPQAQPHETVQRSSSSSKLSCRTGGVVGSAAEWIRQVCTAKRNCAPAAAAAVGGWCRLKCCCAVLLAADGSTGDEVCQKRGPGAISIIMLSALLCC